MLRILTNKFIFWAAWIIIPLIIEVIPAIVNFFILIKKKIILEKQKPLTFFPEISILIPVYNSSKTLYQCIESIAKSNYPNNLINVLLIDNGSKDNSFEVFQKAQLDFHNISMNWIMSEQGKARALNKAIFNSAGKYIINIDSDGLLEENALHNIVRKFENNEEIDCMTGVILTDPKAIDETKNIFLRIFRKLEYMEYCQAFLAGRNYSTEFNTIFTLSGAFSAFRKSILLKTQLYNTDTICEDTHLTFQIKKMLEKRVHLCEDAIFLVDPIDDFDKFYTQRQRWQIGELEVFHMFYKNKMKNPILGFIFDSSFRLMMFDHTAAFPRMIWYFALLALAFMNYSFSSILISVIFLYALYVFCSILFYFNIISFLKNFKEYRKYYATKILYLFLLPLYNLIAYFIRFTGIINSITKKATWKTETLSEEYKTTKKIINNDLFFFHKFRKILKEICEEPEKESESNV